MSSCHGQTPVDPQGLLDAGWVVRSHHEKKGGASRGFGGWRRQPRGQRVGRTGGKEVLVRQGLIQHRMPQMHPRVGLGWRHPQELSLHCLEGVLFHVGEDEEPRVSHH